MNATPVMLTRRSFLVRSTIAGGGLLIGFRLGRWSGHGAEAPGAVSAFAPNAFLRVAPDGTITVFSQFTELGQGVHTSVAMCVAEELDAEWNQVSTAPAPNGPEYAHAWWGFQMTGGSSSTRTSYEQLRKAGAMARALLVAAAAARWGLDASPLRTENSTVVAPDGRSAGYGELALAAAQLPPPGAVPLKEPSAFKLIGRETHRIDSRGKVTGEAVFGFDVSTPGMLTALYVQPPVFGARMRGFNATAARAIAGVRLVAPMAQGVVVVADDFWSAQRATQAVVVDWEPGPLASFNTATQYREYLELLAQPGVVAKEAGNVAAALAGAAHTIEAEFDVPYLAHACMEPINAAAHIKSDGSVEVWAGTQVQDADRTAAARVAGVPAERVTLHTPYVGGGFGRKSGEDYVPLAVEAAKLAGAPVRLLWRREDDMRAGYYRPRTLVRSRLALDPAGSPVAWETDVVSPSIIKRTVFRRIYQNGIDSSQTYSFTDVPYPVPSLRTVWHEAPDDVPVLAWRDPGPIVGSFAIETMIDDAARHAGEDPLAYRLRLVAEDPRASAVLESLRARANWGAAPSGRFQGIAFGVGASVVGEVAEISLAEDRTIRVHRVTVVVDCGLAINPDGVRAQMMSGVIFGLSAALGEEITLESGRVVQSNFHDYPILRMPDAPVVDVHIVPSAAQPSGVGEPSTPLIAPALSNAVLAATGRRLRALPLRITSL